MVANLSQYSNVLIIIVDHAIQQKENMRFSSEFVHVCGTKWVVLKVLYVLAGMEVEFPSGIYLAYFAWWQCVIYKG